MERPFYPFVEEKDTPSQPAARDLPSIESSVKYPARIAVFDDAAAAPRVVIIEPTDIRSYLEQITETVTRLSHEQGGTIPFMVIREIVENLIHAYFIEPTVSILEGGNTIRFTDQGPGISHKDMAMEYGTTSATDEMKRYIRGVGSGLPYVRQYMADKGGCLTIQDNISQGTIVTISSKPADTDQVPQKADVFAGQTQGLPQQSAPVQPAAGQVWQQWPQQSYAQPYPYGMPQQMTQQPYAPQQYAPQPYQYQQPFAAQAPQMQPYPAHGVDQQPFVSERGEAVLRYLETHPNVGPKELTETYGLSQPTWSRELKALDESGLIARRDHSQKRVLTKAGQLYLSSHMSS